MGEYADMAIDDMLSLDEYQLLHPEEFDDGISGWSPFGRVRFSRGKIPTCSICHMTHLYWEQDENNRWYLAEWDEDEEDYVQHVCKFNGFGNTLRRHSNNRS